MLGMHRRPVAVQRDQDAAPDAAGRRATARPVPVLRPIAAAVEPAVTAPPSGRRLLPQICRWLRARFWPVGRHSGVIHLPKHMLSDIGLPPDETGARPLPIRLPRQL
jgi:hypothetical protein